MKVPLLSYLRSNFPYPEKICPFCDNPLDPVNAIHDSDELYIYKVIYVCHHMNCPVFDEDAKKSYVRVYYSCREALDKFEGQLLNLQKLDRFATTKLVNETY